MGAKNISTSKQETLPTDQDRVGRNNEKRNENRNRKQNKTKQKRSESDVPTRSVLNSKHRGNGHKVSKINVKKESNRAILQDTNVKGNTHKYRYKGKIT